MTETSLTCAGCGKPLERTHGHDRVAKYRDPEGLTACEVIVEPKSMRLISATYHYVEGEEQPKWEPEDD